MAKKQKYHVLYLAEDASVNEKMEGVVSTMVEGGFPGESERFFVGELLGIGIDLDGAQVAKGYMNKVGKLLSGEYGKERVKVSAGCVEFPGGRVMKVKAE